MVNLHFVQAVRALKSMQQILSCTSPEPTECRGVALLTLQADLTSINAPTAVIEAKIHGINMWINNQGATQYPVHAPTFGSMRGADILLTWPSQSNTILSVGTTCSWVALARSGVQR